MRSWCRTNRPATPARSISPSSVWSFGNATFNAGPAGAIVGTSLLAKAPADGYTLIMCEIAHGANPALMSV